MSGNKESLKIMRLMKERKENEIGKIKIEVLKSRGKRVVEVIDIILIVEMDKGRIRKGGEMIENDIWKDDSIELVGFMKKKRIKKGREIS